MVSLGACQKDDPADVSQAEETAKADAEGGAAGLGETAKQAIAAGEAAAVGRLERGSALGHFLIAHPSGLLKELREQVAPAGAGMFLDETMLRNLASGQLGSRAGIAEHIDLAKPIGCVLVDSTVAETPFLCALGYQGGVAAAVADLGDTGKQADAKGHTAHYTIEGEDVYLDDLGGALALSSHAELFAQAKPYLESQVLGRADAAISDIEVVGYLGAIATRYADKLGPLLEEAPGPDFSGDNPLAKAFADYSSKSSKTSLARLEQLEQMSIGIGIEDAGVIVRWAGFPVPGSEVEAESKAMAAGPINAAFLEKLPQSSWGVFGFHYAEQAMNNQATQDLKKSLVTYYAEQTKKDPVAVQASLEAFFKEEGELYGNDVGFALVHEPGTFGAAVLTLAKEKSGREAWKAWTTAFTPDAVLDEKSKAKITWSFAPDATVISEAPIDRWVIEPTAEGKKDLVKELASQAQELERKLGGLVLTIDRAELDDRVVFVIAPGTTETATKSAIDAAGGKSNLAGDAGLANVFARVPSPASVFALDVQRAANWMREVLPAEDSAKIPADLGVDLSDVFVAGTYNADGSQLGQFGVSQPFVDKLRKLAD